MQHQRKSMIKKRVFNFVMKFVYKSDLFLFLGFILVSGAIIHVIIWLYKPPDIFSSSISDSEADELVRLYLEREAKLLDDNLDNAENKDQEKFGLKIKDNDVVEPKSTRKLDFEYEIQAPVVSFKRSSNLKENSNFNVDAPVHLKLEGGPAQCRPYNIKAFINESYDCIKIKPKPHATVCLYPSELDIHVSKHIREDLVWEEFILKEFQLLLYENPQYGVIDIGANIGYYSLVAASMNHQVVAVEPFLKNLKHFHQAIKIGESLLS